MVLIPNTTGVESADTDVIGRRSPVTRDEVAITAKKYRSNSMTKQRTHWSLNSRCGMLPCINQKLPLGRLFFLRHRRRYR